MGYFSPRQDICLYDKSRLQQTLRHMADDIFKDLEFQEEDTGAPKTEQELLDWVTNQVNNYYGHEPEVRHYSLVRFCPYTSTPPIYAMHIKNFSEKTNRPTAQVVYECIVHYFEILANIPAQYRIITGPISYGLAGLVIPVDIEHVRDIARFVCFMTTKCTHLNAEFFRVVSPGDYPRFQTNKKLLLNNKAVRNNYIEFLKRLKEEIINLGYERILDTRFKIHRISYEDTFDDKGTTDTIGSLLSWLPKWSRTL